MQLSLLPLALAAFRKGNVGDAAVLKAVALSPASEATVTSSVASLEIPLPDLAALTRDSEPCPGTLGWHHNEFLRINNIKPLRISPELNQQLAGTDLVVARYVLLHDAFHVLLGFDASRSGELAVWTFVAAQRYNPAYSCAAEIARWLYPLLEPGSSRQLALHRARGQVLGSQVHCLLAQPVEKLWSTPLEEARVQLGIPVSTL